VRWRIIGRETFGGMETFGLSAPLKALQNKFGFEPDRVVLVAKEMLSRRDLRVSLKAVSWNGRKSQKRNSMIVFGGTLHVRN
jgi:hypothetical protein